MKEFAANVLVLFGETDTRCYLGLTGSVSVRLEQTVDPYRSICGVAEYVRTTAIISGSAWGEREFAFRLKFADSGWAGLPTVSLVFDLEQDDGQTRFESMCHAAGVRVPGDWSDWTELTVYTDHGLDGSTEEQLRAHAKYLISHYSNS